MNLYLTLAYLALAGSAGAVFLARYLNSRKRSTANLQDVTRSVSTSLETALDQEGQRIARAFKMQGEVTFGARLPGFYIGLDDMADYKPGNPVEPLLVSSDVLNVPMFVGGVYCSLLSLRKEDDGWHAIASTFGDRFDQHLAMVDADGCKASYLLHIPALNERFICAVVEGEHFVFSTGQWAQSPKAGKHSLKYAVTKLHSPAVTLRNHYLRCDGSAGG